MRMRSARARGGGYRTPANTVAQAPRTSRSSVEPLGHDRAVHPAAELLLGDQPGVGQHREVVGHRRLALADRLLEVAAARRALGRRRDQRQQPQPNRVGQRLEGPGQLDGLRPPRAPMRAAERSTHRCVATFSIDFSLHLSKFIDTLTSVHTLPARRRIPCPVCSSPSTSPTSTTPSPSTRSSSPPNRTSASPATPTSPSPTRR